MLHKKQKKLNHYCNVVLKNRWFKPVLSLFTTLGIFCSTSAFAATDELSGAMDSVKANFGTGSAFIKILYLAEIIAGAYAWHQTKHPKAVIGIVILAVFFTFAFTHWIG